MRRSFILWSLAVLLSAAGGFALGRAWAPVAVVSTTVQEPAADRSSSIRSTQELAAALEATRGPGDPAARRLLLLDLLARAEPTELRRLFLSPAASAREKRMIAFRWAEVDPRGLMGALGEVSRSEWERERAHYDVIRGRLFQAWVRDDPEAALAAAAEMERRPQFRGVRWDAVAALFTVDPERAFAVAETLPRWGLATPFPESVWKEDPAAFLQMAGGAGIEALVHAQISLAVGDAFGAWVASDPTAASAWLTDRPPDQRRILWNQLVGKLTTADPAAAQAWFASVPPSAEREQAGVAMVQTWALTDPRAALEWLQDNLEGGRGRAFAHVARALAEQGVDQAKQLVDAMPPGSQRDQVVSSIAQAWSEREFKPAIEWVLSLPPDDPGRRRAMEGLGYRWAEQDLAGAAAFVAAEGGLGESREVLWNLPREFVAQDVTAGVAWAGSLPDGLRDEAFANLLGAAGSTDSLPKVFAAMESLPPEQRQSVVESFVTKSLQADDGGADPEARLLRELKSIPPSMKASARQAAEAAPYVNPARRAAALDALR
jgi:hypothetical protein